MNTAATRLWLVLVEHLAVPGTVPFLFCQDNEPADTAVKKRLADVATPKELTISGVFDLSHAVQSDAGSREALMLFADSISASTPPAAAKGAA